MHYSDSATSLLDLEPTAKQFLEDVLTGMRQKPKQLPCKYFYDERGSQLFEQICLLDEYYLTRCEDLIIKEFAQEMANQIGPGVMLVEYGSGSSTKTRALLDQLADPVAYVPVDISREHLSATATQLSRAYPHIEILPVCADFTECFDLPVSRRVPTHSAVFFPGSTIGNFDPSAARSMLGQIAELCGRGGGLLIGIDLQKEIPTIEAAYNDARGVTADFNRNLLERINRELVGDFMVNQFRHHAVYDGLENRIEMSLVSLIQQRVNIGDQSFDFEQGETIITEHSHKYTIDGFASLAAQVGLTLRKSWTDPQQRFAVLHLALLG